MSVFARMAQRAFGRMAPAPSPISGGTRQVAWAVCSHLIAYPDHEVMERLPLLEDASRLLPDPFDSMLAGVVDRLLAANSPDGEETLADLQQEYVATFDTRKRGCLFLTYFAAGDTRRRGMALLDIKQTMRAAGVELDDSREDELPDHLSVVLEFAGTVDAEAGERILLDNRAGIELLRLHLEEIDSPWAPVLRTVCATFPPLDESGHDAVARLAAEGPAEELVGLSGYGTEADYLAMPPTNAPVAFTPGAGPSGPVPLPTPTLRPQQKTDAALLEGAHHG